jgi:hypothetical protein
VSCLPACISVCLSVCLFVHMGRLDARKRRIIVVHAHGPRVVTITKATQTNVEMQSLYIVEGALERRGWDLDRTERIPSVNGVHTNRN